VSRLSSPPSRLHSSKSCRMIILFGDSSDGSLLYQPGSVRLTGKLVAITCFRAVPLSMSVLVIALMSGFRDHKHDCTRSTGRPLNMAVLIPASTRAIRSKYQH
jgi:hypothetical protein